MRRRNWIVLLIALGFGGWVLVSLYHQEPIQVVQSHLERRDGAVFVDGEIKNRGDSDPGIVNLEVRYYDANGRALGSDTVVVNGMAGGSSRTFSSPQRTLEGVADYSIYLNHGKNPYGN